MGGLLSFYPHYLWSMFLEKSRSGTLGSYLAVKNLTYVFSPLEPLTQLFESRPPCYKQSLGPETACETSCQTGKHFAETPTVEVDRNTTCDFPFCYLATCNKERINWRKDAAQRCWSSWVLPLEQQWLSCRFARMEDCTNRHIVRCIEWIDINRHQ